ncbi:MAG: hypothetical protein KF696_10640 [Planctomycetes bacterium]|nr:hypothetical protein [Planctomycetota bacterium]MCW8135113.1 hypothetical protein [Planctomycetota bacterium]
MELARFLEILFARGEVIFRRAPSPPAPGDVSALRVLEAEYRRYCLDLPGEAPAFSPDVAVRAAEVVRHACWFLLSRDEDPAEVHRALSQLGLPASAADHASADLTLRYLPRVHRRAKAHDPADALVSSLETLLRRWPFSGVLCEVTDAPYVLDLHSHKGLQLEYAQRFVASPRAGWEPDPEYLALVRGQ